MGLTFPTDEDAGMVEEKVPEGVTLRVKTRLPTQTSRLEP